MAENHVCEPTRAQSRRRDSLVRGPDPSRPPSPTPPPTSHPKPRPNFSGTRSFNASGQVLYTMNLQGGVTALYLDDQLLVQQGDPVPGVGGVWSYMLNADVDLDDDGHWAMASHIQDTVDDVLVVDGVVVAKEGDQLPAPDGWTMESVSGARMGGGSVLWFGSWDDPDPTTDQGLFLNHSLLVREGVTQIGGVTLQNFFAPGPPLFDLSDDGRTVVFTGTLANGVSGVFQVDVDPWVDPGGSLAGTGGCRSPWSARGP